MTATLAELDIGGMDIDLSQFGFSFPPITATMTWVFQKVDDSIVADVNVSEDCAQSPLRARHRHLLLHQLCPEEDA